MHKDKIIIEKQNDILKLIAEIDDICKEYNLEYSLAYGSVLGSIRHSGFIPWDTDIDIYVSIEKYDYFCDTLQKKINNKYELKSYKNDQSYEELFARLTYRGEAHQDKHIDIFPLAGITDNYIISNLLSNILHVNYRLFFIKKVNTNFNYKNKTLKKYIVILLKLLLLPISSSLFISIQEKISKLYLVKDSEYLINLCGSYGYKEIIPKSFYEKKEYKKFDGLILPVPKDSNEYLKHMYGVDYMIPQKK